MSDTPKLNPFASNLNPLAVECSRCAHKRELAGKAQEIMDQVHCGRRVFVIPPVECSCCDEGLNLTPLGKQLAILFANYIRELERVAAVESARQAREETLPL